MQNSTAQPLVLTDAHEGPVYVEAEHALYLTVERGIRRIDLETHRIDDLDAAVVRPNGMYADGRGGLLVCEQGDLEHAARISRFDPMTGQLDTVVDEFDGLPLNSPNDVVVGPDGVVWFTDPSYGYLQRFRPTPSLGDFVHRYDPATGRHDVVADGFDKPNGIALSPGGRVLYVTDSGANQEPGTFDPARPHHVEAFDVAGAHLRNRHVLAVIHPGFPDGLKVDASGLVYVSCGRGVQIFDPAGDQIGEIVVPGAVNFAFGGPDRRLLYITADFAVYVAAIDPRFPDAKNRTAPLTTGA
jgi:gluconolactonase